MQIYIKNMVCDRCIAAVRNILDLLDVKLEKVQLGVVETVNELSHQDLDRLEQGLKTQGFGLLRSQAEILTGQVKNEIVLLIAGLDIAEDFLLSGFLSARFHKHYTAISKTFSQQENTTLEQYFIHQKVEKVKELLLYGELTLTEISGKLGYKSVQHLSSQFRNITGSSPTDFKSQNRAGRIPLDKI